MQNETCLLWPADWFTTIWVWQLTSDENTSEFEPIWFREEIEQQSARSYESRKIQKISRTRRPVQSEYWITRIRSHEERRVSQGNCQNVMAKSKIETGHTISNRISLHPSEEPKPKQTRLQQYNMVATVHLVDLISAYSHRNNRRWCNHLHRWITRGVCRLKRTLRNVYNPGLWSVVLSWT